MTTAIPVFRIFDYQKAKEFYLDWLGFQIDWEDKPDDAPVYLQISLQGIIIHLSEHYGDCCPGGRIHVEGFDNLKNYHRNLLRKKYKYMNPGIGKTPWDSKTLCMEVTDPFGNRLTFTGNE
ncbi:MAG TPA: glyoxalase superfamily protein [Flavobacteriales bacterium]|nr:glyoxalase superfamily protein [Flavobacteriales bacterium]